MWKRNLSFSVVATLGLALACVQECAGAVAGDVRLTVRTKNDQSVFHIGEVITLQLAYSLAPASSDSYLITNASYDRSWRLDTEAFHVEPASGWDDPLKLYFASFTGFIGSGGRSSAKLTTTPVVISRNLNEWVRFNAPRRYRLSVTSSRVQPASYSPGTPSLEVRSNEISLTIVPATAEWQKATLETATAKLASPEPANHNSEIHREAIAMLRYLGTPAAAVEMASRLNDESNAFEFMLGLASTPSREAALEKMEELLHDPAFPVSGIFLQALSLVALSPQTISGRPEQVTKLKDKFEEELLKALAAKEGKAQTLSAYTIVNEKGMRAQELPPEERRELTGRLVAGFDSLPVEAQASLLEHRWPTLDQEAMRPLLPKLAEHYTDFPELREIKAYQANELSAAALRDWWEMDPVEARPAVIREIVRPKPRFGADVLGMLPNKTLPEVDQQLADHLTAATGNEEQIASLISRYATASVEAQVVDYLDQRVGKLACATQTPLLAYLLRVDSASAGLFVQRALAARGPGFSACNHSLFVEVANLHNHPILQDFAISSLDDSDPEIAANAAAYLGRYGSRAAEAPLWARLVSWSSEWKGREAQLRYVPGGRMEDVYQAGLGSSLIAAIGPAQGWLADQMKLSRLVDLSVTPEQRSQAEQLLHAWEEQPRQIQFAAIGNGQFDIAQYHSNSVEAAIAKLRQFPAGTHFVWTGDLRQENEKKAFEEISKAVSPNGITITQLSGAP